MKFKNAAHFTLSKIISNSLNLSIFIADETYNIMFSNTMAKDFIKNFDYLNEKN